MKETTDFVNAETGEVLGSIDTYLDVLSDPTEINLAIKIAIRLVGFGCAPENYDRPIIVIATRDFEDGDSMQVTAAFEHLLAYTEDEDEDKEEDDEEDDDYYDSSKDDDYYRGLRRRRRRGRGGRRLNKYS